MEKSCTQLKKKKNNKKRWKKTNGARAISKLRVRLNVYIVSGTSLFLFSTCELAAKLSGKERIYLPITDATVKILFVIKTTNLLFNSINNTENQTLLEKSDLSETFENDFLALYSNWA